MASVLATTAYEGKSGVAQEGERHVIRLFPNLLRGPLHLQGGVADPLVFRDALLTVGDVAASKLYRSPHEILDAVLDPLVTVTDEDVYHEAFSLDESTYVRMTMREGSLRDEAVRVTGCTNVDFSTGLRAGLAELRQQADVGLHVGRRGIAIEFDGRVTRESKVELPSSWMYGFLEVQAALRSPSETLALHPADLRNVLVFLRKRKAKDSPRGLRLLLDPAGPPRAIVQPWNQEFVLRRSRYLGRAATEVVVWGRRRLLLLDRILPHAQQVRVSLQGTGQPSFWTCDVGTVSVLLGLSPWTAREWNVPGARQLFATPCADEEDPGLVATRLRDGRRAGIEIAEALGWPVPRVDAALGRLCVEGRVLYDPEHEAYCLRRVFDEDATPPPPPALGGRALQAQALVDSGSVRLDPVEAGEETILRGSVLGRTDRYRVECTLDETGQLTTGTCRCRFFQRFALGRGPCSHLLALRLAHLSGKISPRPASPD